jgi:DNA-binding NarL/FixJ family response regulator
VIRAAESTHAMHDTIRVVLGRFKPVVAFGLEHVLRVDPRIHVLAAGLGEAELEHVVAEQAPQVAVVDEVAGQGFVERLNVNRAATGVVVFARNPMRSHGLQRLACEASCIAQDASTTDILRAVHFIAQGGRVFLPADGNSIERSYPTDGLPLTERETQVLRYLSADKRYAEIAYALQIRPETVRKHAVSIRRKLNVRGRRDLIGMPVPTTRDAIRQRSPLMAFSLMPGSRGKRA